MLFKSKLVNILKSILLNIFRDAEVALKLLLEKQCKCVIITMGEEGAVFATKENPKPMHVKSPKITCIDSTGAGDSFIGCLTYLLATYKQLSLQSCIEISCFIAAESCTRSGTQLSFPDANVLNNILQKYSL